jgi:hypothetical protein
MKSIRIDIPDWAAQHIDAKSQDLGIRPDELIRALVCSNARAFDPLAQRHFTVPASMAGLFTSERFMIIGREADSITLTPTSYVPFEQALEAFQANGLSEEQILEILAT